MEEIIMSRTYATLTGGRSTLTQRGHSDGVRVSCQSFDGSVIVSNRYDCDDKLELRIGTNEGSGTYTDWKSNDFVGTFEEFKQLLQLHQDIKSGRVSVVRHRIKKQ
jgi:hypothetical protein